LGFDDCEAVDRGHGFGDHRLDRCVGEGSEFRVSLCWPWVSQGISSGYGIQRIGGLRGYQRTLMVVDDGPSRTRFVVGHFWCRLAYNVLEASDAKVCLDELC